MAVTTSVSLAFALSQLRLAYNSSDSSNPKLSPNNRYFDATSLVSLALSNAVGNTAAAGADTVVALVTQLTASGGGTPSSTITISSGLTDVGNNTVGFARLKFWCFILPGSGVAVYGCSASSITIGNAASHPFGFNLNAGTDTFNVNNGGVHLYGDPGATGFVVTTGTNDQIKIANNDASHAATIVTILAGGST